MLSTRYALRETGQNLRRNYQLAVATVVTVGVSLAMFGGFVLFQTAADSATKRWEGGIEFVVWMNAEATPEQDDRIRERLEESSAISRFEYVDQAETFEEFKELFADTPELLESVTAEMLPPSYRVVPADPDADVVEEIGRQFRGQPGVRTVVFAGEAIRGIQDLSDRAGRVLFIGSIVLLGASALLILNTLAIAISNRRQEIEIMRVVGASRWFVRIPFMLEGLIQGVLGALVAVGCNSLLRTYVIDRFSEADALQLLAGFQVDNAALLRTNLVVLGIGVVVSVAGSAAAVTLHLDP